MKVVIIEEEVNIASRLREDMLQSKECPESIDHFTDFFDFVRYLKMHSEPDLLLVDMLQLNNRAMRYLQEGHLSSPLLFTNSFKQTCLRKLEQQDALPAQTAICATGQSPAQPGWASGANSYCHPVLPDRQNNTSRGSWSRPGKNCCPSVQKTFPFSLQKAGSASSKQKRTGNIILPHSIETLSRSLLDPQKFFRVNRVRHRGFRRYP